tara:strand:+ start:358 stop:741 length:384 start_codon:yes stop_codon:yes gene_type:complete
MKSSQNVNGVLSLHAQNVEKVNDIHLANIYGTLARGVRGSAEVGKLQSDSRFKGLLGSTIEKLKKEPDFFGVRAIANIAHSLAKLKISNKLFYNEVSKLHKRIAKEGDPQVSFIPSLQIDNPLITHS